MNAYMMSLDQGTTSTRAIIFDHSGRIVSQSQREHEQILPQAGWVEHNPQEIWDNTREVMGEALSRATLTRHDIAGLGITNQRETALMWNKSTGELVYNAIVWQDTRTQDVIDRMEAAHGSDYFRQRTGLPLATYFAASKLSGFLTTSRAPGRRPKPEISCSGHLTPGCCGTSAGVSREGFMRQM